MVQTKNRSVLMLVVVLESLWRKRHLSGVSKPDSDCFSSNVLFFVSHSFFYWWRVFTIPFSFFKDLFPFGKVNVFFLPHIVFVIPFCLLLFSSFFFHPRE